MNKIIVQIYEVQTPDEAESLMMVGVDHIGSVVVSKKKWKIPSIKETVRAIQSGNAKSSLIPLFNDRDAVFRTIEYYQPDVVHFCEDLIVSHESFQTCENLLKLQAEIQKRFSEVKIMRSIPISRPGLSNRVPTIELARMFEPFSDFFLTDTLLLKPSGPGCKHQPVKGFVGITGQTCDWQMASMLVKSSNIPVILAGGISPENVFEGIMQVCPAGVDSCTQTNATDPEGRTIRFKKDLNKVKRFVEAVRAAEQKLKNNRKGENKIHVYQQ